MDRIYRINRILKNNHVHPVNPVYISVLNLNPRQSSMNRLLAILFLRLRCWALPHRPRSPKHKSAISQVLERRHRLVGLFLYGRAQERRLDKDFRALMLGAAGLWSLQLWSRSDHLHQPAGERTGKVSAAVRGPHPVEAKTVRLVFDGVMTDTEVWINGKPAGPIHQGAFYRFKYDITPLLKFGEPNLLEVTVSKVSANDSVNRAERFGSDYWVLAASFVPCISKPCRPSLSIGQLSTRARTATYPSRHISPASRLQSNSRRRFLIAAVFP